MITQETAAQIWHCYREIETAEKLLSDMKKEQAFANDKYAPAIKDAFGRAQHLQMGIPRGDNSHRLFNVSPVLAESVIRAHIARKRAELADANERARIEINAPAAMMEMSQGAAP